MSTKSGANRLTAAQRRLHRLRDEIAAAASDPAQLADLTEEVRTALQELEVAHEELQQQNEELMATREALEIQRHRYLDLFEHAPYGYLVTDAHGVIEEVNQEASVLLGAEPWRLTGKPFLLFIDKQDRPALRDLIPRLKSGTRAEEREMLLQPRTGPPLPVTLTAVRDIDGQGNAQRLRWMLRDISRTKRAEEALRESEERLRHAQRLEAIGRLAGGIAHSFNNLLAAIAFHSELLHEHLAEDHEGQSHVQAIEGASERAAVLARQLLAFGRKQVLQPQVLSLNRVIGEVEPILRRLLGEDVELAIELDPREAFVDADPGQIEQVLLNLVTNARDAMPYGGRLTIGTTLADPPPAAGQEELPAGTYLKLWVADTGVGMSEEVRFHLFEPFFTTKEKHKGTGLGLATVYGIVHQSGGAVTVDSEPGKGACFNVYLPLSERPAAASAWPAAASAWPAAASAWPAAASEPAPLLPSRRQGSEVILLVEDEENIRTPAIEILESRGYRVLPAGDATEALDLVARHPEPIHLMVTDVIMPGMSGGQLAERLAAERPGLKVVYISGYPEDAIAHHGVLSPEHVFLQKPFSPAALLGKVREVLDNAVVRTA